MKDGFETAFIYFLGGDSGENVFISIEHDFNIFTKCARLEIRIAVL
jgi:hypothetical protein